MRDELPEGWGHAIHAGVQESHGDWLLFTDADTWHAPNALQCALTSALNAGSDLYSLGTAQELPGFWEKGDDAYGLSWDLDDVSHQEGYEFNCYCKWTVHLVRRTVYDTRGYARSRTT